MRTAQMLKILSHVLLLAGLYFALTRFSIMTIEFWLVILVDLVLWVILRMVAIAGQLLFDLRNDSLRLLTNIERALHYSNALTAEVRDITNMRKCGE